MSTVYIARRVVIRAYGRDFMADMKAFDTKEKAETYLKDVGMSPPTWPMGPTVWTCYWDGDVEGYIDELTIT